MLGLCLCLKLYENMRNFIRKETYNGKIYKNEYSSSWNKKLKWKVILPNQVKHKLENVLHNFPPSFKLKENIALYFLSLISSVPSYTKDKYYEGGYVNLSSEKLKKVDTNYNNYFKYFVKHGIIEKNNSYSSLGNKKFCKSYRYNYKSLGKLTFKFFDLELKQKTYDKISRTFPTIQRGMKFMTQWLNSNLTINHKAVWNEIQEKTKHRTIEEEKTYKKLEHYLQNLKRIQFCEFHSSRNKTSDNRLHTNLTNMPRFFRKHIKYAGNELAGVDIKNSQPFFLIILIDTLNKMLCTPSQEVIEDKIEERKRKIIEDVYKDNNGTMSLKICETLANKDFQAEFNLIKKHILKGDFYEFLGTFFSFTKDINGKYSRYFYDSNNERKKIFYFDTKRDLLKRLILFFLYKSNNTKNDKEYDEFKKHFPQFCKLLELLKEDDKKKLPKVLQHLEADCVLDYTCKAISKEFPTIPLFTIHDSIITINSKYDTIESQVKTLFTEYCNGIEPNLKKEIWSE